MKTKKYDKINEKYIEVEALGRVKYIGESFGVDGLTNGKTYYVIGIEDGMFRIIDDSEMDYLYSIYKPSSLSDYRKNGKWEVIEDSKNKDLKKILG